MFGQTVNPPTGDIEADKPRPNHKPQFPVPSSSNMYKTTLFHSKPSHPTHPPLHSTPGESRLLQYDRRLPPNAALHAYTRLYSRTELACTL